VAPGRHVGDAQHPADFLERQPLVVAEDDGRPLVRPEPGQRVLERTAEGALFDGIRC
jgi:hypothetical protein